jgi:hypothetical protein
MKMKMKMKMQTKQNKNKMVSDCQDGVYRQGGEPPLRLGRHNDLIIDSDEVATCHVSTRYYLFCTQHRCSFWQSERRKRKKERKKERRKKTYLTWSDLNASASKKLTGNITSTSTSTSTLQYYNTLHEHEHEEGHFGKYVVERKSKKTKQKQNNNKKKANNLTQRQTHEKQLLVSDCQDGVYRQGGEPPLRLGRHNDLIIDNK